MPFMETIQTDMKAALKANNAEQLSVLRSLKSALKNAKIAKGAALTQEDAVQVLQKAAKQRHESIQAFRSAGRDDLADKEQHELSVIQGYLPAQLTDDELKAVVSDVVNKLGNTPQFGAVMGQVMSQVKGKADGTRVKAIVKAMLG